MSSLKEFFVSQFISLRLINSKTEIFINGRHFKQCKFLMINIPVEEVTILSEITSIDEASEKLGEDLESATTRSQLSPQMEFWGHCSNIQVWFENDYNTSLLHMSLAFPLLKELASVGDPVAQRVFKEEIAKRFESGYKPVITFLLKQGYTNYLSDEELESVLPYNVEDLDLSGLQLKEVPQWVKKLRSLKSLNLANNFLSFLPEWFSELNSLEELNISYNSFLEVPKTIMSLSLVENLNLSKNNIIVIPDWLGMLSQIKVLNLSNNPIEYLSESIGSLHSIRELNLTNVNLKQIPAWISVLHSLRKLITEVNFLDEIPNFVGNLVNLEELKLSFNQIYEIPQWIDELRSLKVISLGYNSFDFLPDTLQYLIHLEVLNFENSNLNYIPDWFGNLTRLKEINFRNTLISQLPSSFLNLNMLELLILEGVKFLEPNKLSEYINGESLKFLNLRKTGFTNIYSLKNFLKLKTLDLAENDIDNISDLTHLRNLRELSICENKYPRIEGLDNLVDLEILDMDLPEIDGLQNLVNLRHLTIKFSDDLRILLDKLGGLWEETEYTEYVVNYPQNIVDYCRKKRFSTEEFWEEYREIGLSEISVLILEERSKNGDKRALELLMLDR